MFLISCIFPDGSVLYFGKNNICSKNPELLSDVSFKSARLAERSMKRLMVRFPDCSFR